MNILWVKEIVVKFNRETKITWQIARKNKKTRRGYSVQNLKTLPNNILLMVLYAPCVYTTRINDYCSSREVTTYKFAE